MQSGPQTFENFVSKTSNGVVESNQNEARILLNANYSWKRKYIRNIDVFERKDASIKEAYSSEQSSKSYIFIHTYSNTYIPIK